MLRLPKGGCSDYPPPSICGAVAFAPDAVVRYVEAPLADVLNVAASGHDVTELLEDSVKSGAARVRRARTASVHCYQT